MSYLIHSFAPTSHSPFIHTRWADQFNAEYQQKKCKKLKIYITSDKVCLRTIKKGNKMEFRKLEKFSALSITI